MRHHHGNSFSSAFVASIVIHALCFTCAFLFFGSQERYYWVDIPVDLVPAGFQEETIDQLESFARVEELSAKESVTTDNMQEVDVSDAVVSEIPSKEAKTAEDLETVTEKSVSSQVKVSSGAVSSRAMQLFGRRQVSARRGRTTRSRKSSRAAAVPKMRIDNFPYAYYVKILRTKVNDAWEIPASVTGEWHSVVYFRIDRQGKLIECRIDKKSGKNEFDEEGVRAVRKAAPFAPLPDAYDEPYLGVYCAFDWKE